jgi:hypothetical protein
VDRSDHYPFLASAVAGRHVPVRAAPGTQALACSDGQSIVLPLAAQRTGRPAWQDVVAQAALIGAGSLEPQLLRGLIGRPEAARRYGYLEVLRAARLLAGRLPSAFLALPQIDCGDAPTQSAAESLRWALSGRPVPAPAEFFGCIRPMMVLRKSLSEEGLTALTRKVDFDKPRAAENGDIHDDDDEAVEESKILRLLQNPLFGGNRLSDMLNKILGARPSRGLRDKVSEGAELPIGKVERAQRRGVHAVAAKNSDGIPEIDLPVGPSEFAYPEWHMNSGAYRPAWALVEEVEAWRPDGARSVLLELPAPALKRQLGQLGLDYEMHRHQLEGSEFDVGRLLDYAVETAAGHSPPALDVYRGNRRTRRDLAVSIALDISGSTGESNLQGRSVFDRQLLAAYQLGLALTELGDSVTIYGFHSWGRKLVRCVRLKRPHERWSALLAERFALLEPVGYTRTGAAIRHGVRQMLAQTRLPNRLLILITDGIAYDQDYESRYAEEDTRVALQEARSHGTAVVCLCVGGTQDLEKLRAVFGGANLLIVDEPEQIAGVIRRICQQALAGVSRRKFKPVTLSS